MNQQLITTISNGAVVFSSFVKFVTSGAPVWSPAVPVFNFLLYKIIVQLKKDCNPVGSLNRRFTGFNRVCPVHAGSHRFDCIADPICQPNRWPLRFTVVEPVRSGFKTMLSIATTRGKASPLSDLKEKK